MHPSLDRLTLIVDAVRTLATYGTAQDWIAAELNARNVPTLSGKPGSRWFGAAVRRVARANGIALSRRRSRAFAGR